MFIKKVLAVFLAVCMFASFLSGASFASEGGDPAENNENVITENLEDKTPDPDPEPDPDPDPEPDPDPDPEPDPNPEPDQNPDPENNYIQPVTVSENLTVEATHEEISTDVPNNNEEDEKKPVFTEIPEDEKHIAVYLNEEGYESLQDAIDAAGEQDSDIYLHEPVEEDVEIGKNQSITISLNGCGFSGEMINFGSLTILGEGFFEGSLLTRAYHIKEGGETVDFASGRTLIKNGMFSGILAIEQKSDAPLENDDPLPQLIIEGGTFINDEGEELVKRYVSWNESGNPEYSESDDAGEILLKGGTFAHYPMYEAPGYHVIDYGGMYGIEVFSGEETFLQVINEGESPVLLSSEEEEVKSKGNIIEKETTKKEEKELSQETIPDAQESDLIEVPMLTLNKGELSFVGEANTGDGEVYTITYDTAVPVDAPTSYKSGEGATLPVPSDTTIPFAGWYADSAYTDGPYTTIAAGSTGNRFFYARWQYKVQVYVNGNTYGHANYKDIAINTSNTFTLLSGEDFVLELVPATEKCRVSDVQVDGMAVSYSSTSVTVESSKVHNNMIVNVYFAQWPTHLISFNYNDEGTTEKKESYIKNATALTFETPARKGYLFKGWQCSLDGDTYFEGDEYTVTHSAEFTAQWELEEYALTYYVNNRSVDIIPPQTFTVNTETFELFIPDIPNATFLNWYEAQDFSGESLSKIEKGTARNVNVYGKWEYSVFLAFNAEGGVVTANKPIIDGKTTVATGESVTLTATANDGYVLKEVNVKRASEEPVTISGNTYTFSEMNEDAFFNAEFLKPYIATFIANDGSGSQSSQTVIPGQAVTLPERFRSGYQFNGWLSSEDNKIHTSGNYIPKGDVTLTAQWEKIPTYYRVYVYHNSFGTVSYNGSVIPNRSYFEVEEGDSLTMYFNPLSTSYYPYNCTVNNVKKGSISSLTLENIRDNQVVSVTFAPTFARPMTGDSSRLLLWTGLMAFSGVAAGILLGRKKKKQQ